MVTGSIIDNNRANGTTEIYDVKEDSWKELARLNTPRHFHSMCDRNGDFVHIFCGQAGIRRSILMNYILIQLKE